MREAYINIQLGTEQVRAAYTEWGDPLNPRVVLCVHGLTRNSRDFDLLGHALSSRFRVICPDIVGRGRSDWLSNKALYVVPTYVIQIQQMCLQLGIMQMDWVGTSLGGLIGMGLAALPNSTIRRMVLNDIGPYLPAQGLRRIQQVISDKTSVFPDYVTAKQYFKLVYGSFGDMPESQWDHMVITSVMPQPDGTLRLAYDPDIVTAFSDFPDSGIQLWEIWQQITCPVLVLRGAQSDLLLPETVKQMAETGPRAQVLEWPGIGHAPSLRTVGQVEPVLQWLTQQ